MLLIGGEVIPASFFADIRGREVGLLGGEREGGKKRPSLPRIERA